MNQDFNYKCFKCVEEQESSMGVNKTNNILLNKIKEGLVGKVGDEIYVCEKHK